MVMFEIIVMMSKIVNCRCGNSTVIPKVDDAKLAVSFILAWGAW